MTKRISRDQVASVKARLARVKADKPSAPVKAATVRQDVFTMLMGKRDDDGTSGS